MSAIILAEIFLMLSGAFIALGLALGFVVAIAYFMETLDD
jgi:uncharacterized protein YneF (UPF0154 family)